MFETLKFLKTLEEKATSNYRAYPTLMIFETYIENYHIIINLGTPKPIHTHIREYRYFIKDLNNNTMQRYSMSEFVKQLNQLELLIRFKNDLEFELIKGI
ncbi:MAG: hypothetical protein H7836_13110 [Magnetococcus sp. YQC-3]